MYYSIIITITNNNVIQSAYYSNNTKTQSVCTKPDKKMLGYKTE